MSPNGLGINFKSDNQVTAPSNLMMQVNTPAPDVYAPDNMMMKVTQGDNTVTQNTDTPWYKEPLYSKAARYGQAAPGVIAAITAMKNKKRKLTPDKMEAQRVNYEPERIIAKEENRNALNAGLRQMRTIGATPGAVAGNTRELVLNANKGLAGKIAESVMRENNTNAQLAQQAAGANFEAGNQFKQLNEQMFQNAQTQGIAGLQDTTGKLANTAQEERKQYLQEWIAKNRLGTRSYKTNINGQDVYVNSLGQVYDDKGNLLSTGTV
jgi:hypothetical protein